MNKLAKIILAASLITMIQTYAVAAQQQTSPDRQTEQPGNSQPTPAPAQTTEPVQLPPPATDVKTSPESDSDQEQTLLTAIDLENAEHGGFGGPEFKFSRVNGEPAYFVGGKGGWIINHSFYIGGGFYGMVNEDIKVDNDPKYERTPGIYEDKPILRMGYGGMMLGWIIGSNSVVHANFSTLIGAGGVNKDYNLIDPLEVSGDDDTNDANDSSGVFVLEPVLEMEINVTKFLRPAIGVGYRYVTGLDLAGVKERDLRDFTATASLKFGSF